MGIEVLSQNRSVTVGVDELHSIKDPTVAAGG